MLTSNLHSVARASMVAIGPEVDAAIKGSCAIYFCMCEAIQRDEIFCPGDLDIAIKGMLNPSDLLAAAQRVKAAVVPLFSARVVRNILRLQGCNPDKVRSKVADQSVSWDHRSALPLLAWLHPWPIRGYRDEEVWLARVGLSIKFGRAPCLLPLIDLVAETKPPLPGRRREEGTAMVQGVFVRSLEHCAQEHLRMLFDETGARPWRAKNASKRLQRCVLMAAWLWRGSRAALSIVFAWLKEAQGSEAAFAASVRGRLVYVLHDACTVRLPELRKEEGWRSSNLRELVVALRCMMRRFHVREPEAGDTWGNYIASMDLVVSTLQTFIEKYAPLVAPRLPPPSQTQQIPSPPTRIPPPITSPSGTGSMRSWIGSRSSEEVGFLGTCTRKG